MAAPRSPFVIGIDLGTTFSCVGVWKNNRVEIIANDMGDRTTPSVVAFTEADKPLVGKGAKNYARMDPENTLFDAKRLIGRRFNDPVVQEDMKHWPFKIVNMNDKPFFKATKKGLALLAPEEISTYVLRKMKETADKYLGCSVRDAVITCPAYFSNSQREATISAAVSAGLNVLRIINEPTAAAIAYGLDLKTSLENSRRNVIVFDFGGGTFDVSLVTLERSEVKVLRVDGDTHLGGEDLNNILVQHFAEEFRRETGKDILKDAKSSNMEVSKKANRSLTKLRAACETAKLELSSNFDADIDFSYDGENFSGTITRTDFEQLCMGKFRQCITILERLLSNARMSKGDINDIVLVGGSTRIPRVQKMVSDFFEGRELKHSVNPDEAVAYGATIQAAILSGQVKYVIGDVTPHTLATDDSEKRMAVIIPCHTPIPCKKSRIFSTAHDNQTGVHVGVYEGEKPMCADNNLLGEFNLSGIPPQPAHVPKIDVVFEIDSNGVLHVSAKDLATGGKNQIEITRTFGV